jgi:hypothetical protein
MQLPITSSIQTLFILKKEKQTKQANKDKRHQPFCNFCFSSDLPPGMLIDNPTVLSAVRDNRR